MRCIRCGTELEGTHGLHYVCFECQTYWKIMYIEELGYCYKEEGRMERGEER